jgi:NADH dehydrogenase
MKPPRVVIIGAGFGGLWAARALAGYPVDIVLLDRNNYHAFWPLLYQVAAAELEAEQIAHPVRRILRRNENVAFVMAEVQEADFAARTIATSTQSIAYDYLVLALGSSASFFGIPGAAERAFPLKTMEESVALRNHILRSFERALQEPDPERRRQLLTFVVVGGGPTGVEYAGALSELVYGPLAKDYRGVNIDEVRIVLVEMLETLLAGMPQKLGRYALQRLLEKQVRVRLNTAVAEVTGEAVYFKDGSELGTATVIWTAGVRGAPPAERWGLPTTKDGRVEVLRSLQVPGLARVYAIGDLAAFLGDDGEPLPMLAPVAMQQGEHAAGNIMRQVQGADPLPFHYRDKGVMATVGRSAAVARIGGQAFTGFFAWIIWLAVHLFQLIGFRNRLVVLINWAWSYLFFERVVRLILPVKEEFEEALEDKQLEEA